MHYALRLPVVVLAFLYLNPIRPQEIAGIYHEKPAERSAVESAVRAHPNGSAAECANQVALRMIATAGRYYQHLGWSEKFNRFQWEFHEVDGVDSACFALPDGRIAVFGGIVRMAGQPAPMAYVIGHAVGHVLLGHRSKQKRLAAPPFMQQYGALAWAQLEDFSQMAAGLESVYRENDEREADRLSLTLMQLAGFDPSESLRFWEKIAPQTGGRTKSKHLDQRIKNLQKDIPEIVATYKPLPEDEQAFGAGAPCLGAQLPGPDNTSAPETVLPAGKVPVSGVYIFVLVDVVPASAISPLRIAPLESIGAVYLDETRIDGLHYTRILLGNCPDMVTAKKKQARAMEIGFPKAVVVEYKEGKKGRILY